MPSSLRPCSAQAQIDTAGFPLPGNMTEEARTGDQCPHAGLVQLQERHHRGDQRKAPQATRVRLVHLPLLQVQLQDRNERPQHRPVDEVLPDEHRGVEAVALANRNVEFEAVGHDDELCDRHLGAWHHLQPRVATTFCWYSQRRALREWWVHTLHRRMAATALWTHPPNKQAGEQDRLRLRCAMESTAGSSTISCASVQSAAASTIRWATIQSAAASTIRSIIAPSAAAGTHLQVLHPVLLLQLATQALQCRGHLAFRDVRVQNHAVDI